MHFTTWAVSNQESSGESETKTPTLDVKVRQRAAGVATVLRQWLWTRAVACVLEMVHLLAVEKLWRAAPAYAWWSYQTEDGTPAEPVPSLSLKMFEKAAFKLYSPKLRRWF